MQGTTATTTICAHRHSVEQWLTALHKTTTQHAIMWSSCWIAIHIQCKWQPAMHIIPGMKAILHAAWLVVPVGLVVTCSQQSTGLDTHDKCHTCIPDFPGTNGAADAAAASLLLLACCCFAPPFWPLPPGAPPLPAVVAAAAAAAGWFELVLPLSPAAPVLPAADTAPFKAAAALLLLEAAAFPAAVDSLPSCALSPLAAAAATGTKGAALACRPEGPVGDLAVESSGIGAAVGFHQRITAQATYTVVVRGVLGAFVPGRETAVQHVELLPKSLSLMCAHLRLNATDPWMEWLNSLRLLSWML